MVSFEFIEEMYYVITVKSNVYTKFEGSSFIGAQSFFNTMLMFNNAQAIGNRTDQKNKQALDVISGWLFTLSFWL